MAVREGSLEAPQRRPIDWRSDAFHDKADLNAELERVFDICHGCRRCVSLCDAFPTLFDLVDESDTLEVDGVDQADYAKVVEQCFLCDLCAQTKCPYLPPHEWAVDFPHLMLRAKAERFKAGQTRWRDRLITSTDPVFKMLSTPGVARAANAAATAPKLRKAGESVIGLHAEAPLPKCAAKPLSRRTPDADRATDAKPRPPLRDAPGHPRPLPPLQRHALAGGAAQRPGWPRCLHAAQRGSNHAPWRAALSGSPEAGRSGADQPGAASARLGPRAGGLGGISQGLGIDQLRARPARPQAAA